MLARITLSLLILAAAVGAQSQSPELNAARPTVDIPTVSLCALLSKPVDYEGKKVRVRAQYNIGFEWSYFADSSCKNYAVETTPYLTANVVWAEFDSSVETETTSELYLKFRKASGFCCPDEWKTKQTELLVTGKFFKANSDEISQGYGHSGRYVFKLVVYKIEDVGDTKTVSP